MKSTKELQTIATQIRRDILRMTTAAKSGHPGGSLGTADWMTAMQFEIMKHDPEHFSMDGKGQDMLFVSQGHITPVIYSTMARRGYFPVSELNTFRKFGTRLQGHPPPSTASRHPHGQRLSRTGPQHRHRRRPRQENDRRRHPRLYPPRRRRDPGRPNLGSPHVRWRQACR